VNDILKLVAEAAYNGVCLAAENGETEDYEASGVSGVLLGAKEANFEVPLADGRKVVVDLSLRG
jgi:hypothetical protein